MTNLLFLWKPQTINHCVQSGGLSSKFSTSSLYNDPACVWRTPTGSHFGPHVSQDARVRSRIKHNGGTARGSPTSPGLHQTCGEMTQGDESASVNVSSRETSVCVCVCVCVCMCVCMCVRTVLLFTLILSLSSLLSSFKSCLI